jgi:hypothetical protein
MIRALITLTGLIGAQSAPAFADYYIVHGPARYCRVVERFVPGEERDIVRVGPLRLGTREEAGREVRVICRDQGYYRDDDHYRDSDRHYYDDDRYYRDERLK